MPKETNIQSCNGKYFSVKNIYLSSIDNGKTKNFTWKSMISATLNIEGYQVQATL